MTRVALAFDHYPGRVVVRPAAVDVSIRRQAPPLSDPGARESAELFRRGAALAEKVGTYGELLRWAGVQYQPAQVKKISEGWRWARRRAGLDALFGGPARVKVPLTREEEREALYRRGYAAASEFINESDARRWFERGGASPYEVRSLMAGWRAGIAAKGRRLS